MDEVKYCKLCGQPFKPKGKKVFCDRKHLAKCEWCGKEFELVDLHYPHRTCSPECRRALRKQNAEKTSLEKYGVKNAGGIAESKAKVNATCQRKYGVNWPGQADIQKQHVQETFEKNGGNPMQRPECRQKAAQTCLERYGAESPFSKQSSIREYVCQRMEDKYGTRDPGNLPEFREKARQTCLKHYGAEYYLQTEEGKAAMKQGMLNKYGVEHPMRSPEIVDKIRKTNMKKYGVDCILRCPEIQAKIIQSNLEKYGVPYYCMHENCYTKTGARPSRLTETFGVRLEQACGKPIEYEFGIGMKRFDIHIKDSNLLFEINPTYTHTTVNVEKYGSVTQTYHKDKSRIAEENGYRCIHIFDWDDTSKIMQMFIPKNNIYARKCKINLIDSATASEFLANYHLQGSCKGQEICYGLYYNNELVQVITFGKPRYNNKFQWELLRLCTAPGIRVTSARMHST